jgi:hypothetical protein
MYGKKLKLSHFVNEKLVVSYLRGGGGKCEFFGTNSS